MKKILPLLLFVLTAVCAYTQPSLAFCTSIEQNGYCYFNNDKFIAQQDSANARIYIRVGGNVALGTTTLTYKIFTGGVNNDEQKVASFDQSIQADWMMAWMPYYFAAGKKYVVKVYNDAGTVICSKQLEMLKW